VLFPAKLTILAAATVVSVSGVTDALKPDTLYAFDRYVRLTEQRIEGEVGGSASLLWIDRQPTGARPALMSRLERGEVVSERLQTRDGGKQIEAPGALIHHWVGTVLLPGARLSRVKPMIQDYNRYSEWFNPLIRRARVNAHEGDRFVVAMRTEMQKILTVTVDADYAIDYRTVSTTAFHVRSIATSIHIVDSAGTASERRTPAEQTFGFLWRLNTYCSFREVPAGTIEQCESISLTRNVPFGLGTVVRPLVSGIPRETLEFTLGQVRKLVSAPRN
jgi:hypothetical protein